MGKFAPTNLVEIPNWVVWKKVTKDGNKPTKVPFRIDGKPASTTNPDDWSTAKEVKAVKEDYDGLGFVLPLDNTITFIDLDNCVVNGELNDFAKDILSQFEDTYAEYSQSGNGVHILCKASLPVVNGQVACIKKSEIEIYSCKRYCCMTFNSIHNKDLCDCQDKVTKLFNKYYEEKIPTKAYEPQMSDLTIRDIQDIISHSANADKFNYLFYSAEANSENTASLCMILAFYCQKDPVKMKDMISMSAMWRDKCNSRRGDSTWLDKEIETAIAKTRETFSPQKDKVIDTEKHVEEENSSMFVKLSNIKDVDEENVRFMKSGVYSLDTKIRGFAKGEVSVWSGRNGSGKSNFLQQQLVEYIAQGYKVMLLSGEMQETKVKQIFHSIVAGKSKAIKLSDGDFYYVKDAKTKSLIDNWLDKSLFLYSNANNFIISDIIRAIRYAAKQGVEAVVLDNLTILKISEYGSATNEAQSEFARELARLSKELDIHIHIVMHPRKSTTFLRKEDISGSSDLTNLADNVFIIHRVDTDFKNRIVETYDKQVVANLSNFDNVIEVCKNRRYGVQDTFIGLKFEKESRRFYGAENPNKWYMTGI